MKNLVVLISLVILLAIVWGIYQVVGEYLALFFFIVAIALLFKNSKGPKFNNPNRPSDKS
ncbi:hypothetical protein [Photobacterium kagoshimensis]|uniref:hypothetical protein n=1 Tax=Photobacterium kagoshimensis TaxID=2910242 RepID=UPI003D0CD9AE